MSDGDAYILPSACLNSDLNETTQESVAVQVFHELISLNASQECVEGFKPWICRQLYSVCQNQSYYINSTGEECEVFQALCAGDTSSLLMTSSQLRNVCFFSTTATSSQVG